MSSGSSGGSAVSSAAVATATVASAVLAVVTIPWYLVPYTHYAMERCTRTYISLPVYQHVKLHF